MPRLRIQEIIDAGEWGGMEADRSSFAANQIKMAVSATLQLALLNPQDKKAILVEKIDGEWFVSVTADV